jgi:hypothetical protein
MKKLIYFSFLFVCLVSFGQNNTTNYRFLPSLASVNVKPVSFQINLGRNNWLSKKGNLSLYNPTTNLNDNYYVLGKSYRMSNTKTFSMYGFEGQRIDSFNPSGTKDLGSAFIFGAINTILDKL